MCMHKKQKNKYNVLNSYVKYKVNEIENYKSSLKFLHNHLDICSSNIVLGNEVIVAINKTNFIFLKGFVKVYNLSFAPTVLVQNLHFHPNHFICKSSILFSVELHLFFIDRFFLLLQFNLWLWFLFDRRVDDHFWYYVCNSDCGGNRRNQLVVVLCSRISFLV